MLKPSWKSGIAVFMLVAAAGLMTVVAGCATGPAAKPEAGAAQTDTDIVAAVQQRFEMDPVTRRNAIGVHCNGGVVKLSGAIRHPEVRARAIGIARNTPGVKEVVDTTVNF